MSRAQLLTTAEGRRALSEASPTFFDSYYCGMWKARHRSAWLDTIEQGRKDALEAKRAGNAAQDKSRLLLLAPRDHGKTETAISVALRAVCLDRNIRILWISEAQGVAVKRVRRLRKLLNSARVKEDWTGSPELGFGPFRPPKGSEDDKSKWTDTQIYVQRTLDSVDPTIEAVGSGGSITGGHFDLILCDDLEDDRTTYTAAQRAKTRSWWTGTVLPMLSRGGMICVIGTRKHHDDLYAHLKQDPLWSTIEDPAIIEWPDNAEIETVVTETGDLKVTGVKIHGNRGKVLWPEERPIEYLIATKAEIKDLMFAREFQHKVQDDSSAAVKIEHLEMAKRRGANLRLGQIPDGVDLHIVQGWDLTLVEDEERAKDADNDFTVGITLGKDVKTGDRYLLGIRRKRGVSPGLIRGLVTGEFESFGGLSKVSAVAVERNAFGALHYSSLRKTTDLPIKPHTTTGRKKADPWEGIPSIATFAENGKLILPYHPDDTAGRALVDVFVQELWGLGTEPHDDTVLAFWIAECVLRQTKHTYRVASEHSFYDQTTGETVEEPVGQAAYAKEAEDARAAQIWSEVSAMFPDAEWLN